jgi:hypothetical protein
MSRKERINKKHERIRMLFEKRYTKQPRINGCRKFTSEYIIAGLADEFYLSMRQIENIVYTKPAAAVATAPAAATPFVA